MSITTLNLGKRRDTHEDLTVEVVASHRETTVLFVIGAPEQTAKYIAERILSNMRPPMVLAYLNNDDQDPVLYRHCERLGRLATTYPDCPLLIVSEGSEVLRPIRDETPRVTGAVHIDDEGNISYYDGKNSQVSLL